MLLESGHLLTVLSQFGQSWLHVIAVDFLVLHGDLLAHFLAETLGILGQANEALPLRVKHMRHQIDDFLLSRLYFLIGERML